jgi:hypothetical protein
VRDVGRYAESRILVVGQASNVKNLTGSDGADVVVRQREYSDGATLSGNELHFIGGFAVAMDYHSHVARLEACVRERPAENHRI